MIGDNYVLVIRESKTDAVFGHLQAEVERIIKDGFYLPLGAPVVLDRGTQLVAIQAMLHKGAPA